jgi:hypothetical protein
MYDLSLYLKGNVGHIESNDHIPLFIFAQRLKMKGKKRKKMHTQ